MRENTKDLIELALFSIFGGIIFIFFVVSVLTVLSIFIESEPQEIVYLTYDINNEVDFLNYIVNKYNCTSGVLFQSWDDKTFTCYNHKEIEGNTITREITIE